MIQGVNLIIFFVWCFCNTDIFELFLNICPNFLYESQFVPLSSAEVKPEDKEHNLISAKIEWVMLVKPLLDFTKVFEVSIAPWNTQIRVLFTGSVLGVGECCHGIINPSTLMHTVNPLKMNSLIHSSSSCQPSMTIEGSTKIGLYIIPPSVGCFCNCMKTLV